MIKVEDPKTGDPIRNWRYLHDGTSLWWYVQARNKQSVALNLKDLATVQTYSAVDGTFSLQSLPSGIYKIIAVKQGFEPGRIEDEIHEPVFKPSKILTDMNKRSGKG